MAKQFTKLFLIGFSGFLLASCAYFSPRQIEVQQGNQLTPTQIAKVKKGMTRQQVAQILGSPVLDHLFEQDRWDYLETYQKGRKIDERHLVSVNFKKGRVVSIVRA